jgi:DNA-binding SARP family transcriptional activator
VVVIRCDLLGPVVVTVDDGPAPPELLWRKNLGLLVYLALSPRRTRTRDHLIGLLWADRPEASARHSLNEALRVLRRLAGDSAIGARADQVTLADGVVQLDLDRFTALASAGDCAGAAELVAGAFLEGFSVPGASAFEDWLAAERRLWGTRSVEILVRWGEQLVAGGRTAEATAAAERALRLDPLAEGPMRVLMTALALGGEPTMALERYHAQAQQLAELLGTEPSPALRDLANRVQRGRRAPPRPAAEASRLRRPPLVGRERELRQLLDVWTECRDRRVAGAAVVLAHQGLGKTRLVEEVAGRVQLDGGAGTTIRAVAADLGRPGGGLRAIADGDLIELPGVAGAPPEAVAALAEHSPRWGERFPRAGAGSPLPLERAISLVLGTVTDERPVLLAVDDAHCFDDDSLLAVTALPRDLAGRPFLLLLAAAPEPPRPALDALRARLGRDVPGATVTLGPLGTAGLGELVTWYLPGYQAAEAERLVRRLTMDSAGLPLLATELLSAVALGLELTGDAGAWPQPLRTLDDTLPGDLPDAIIGALRTSYRQLSPAARQILAAATVLEEPVTAAQLVRITDFPLPDVEAGLDEAEWSRWLVADGRGYTFLARVLRDVVGRDMLTPGQRQRLASRLP